MKAKTPKKLKTMIIKAPKVKPFDLTFKDVQENTKIIIALESLKGNAGWQFLTQVLKKNIEVLTNQIISKRDGDGELKEETVDLLRDKHAYLTELLDKPDMFIKKLQGGALDKQLDDLDPYE